MPLVCTVLVIALSQEVDGVIIVLLDQEGYSIHAVSGLDAALEAMQLSHDLVLLDAPADADLAHVPALRAVCRCPLLVIGPARNGPRMVAALEHGADDYLPRPLRGEELLARIRAHLRRYQRGQEALITIGSLRIEPRARQASYDNRPLALSPEEFTLLDTLSARPGIAYPAALLIERVWGAGRADSAALVELVARLRALFEADPATPRLLGGSLAEGFWLGERAHERAIND
jgi:DNA-binding response OmpR family regulator